MQEIIQVQENMVALVQDTSVMNERKHHAVSINKEIFDHDLTLETDEYPNTNTVLPDGTEDGDQDITNAVLLDSSKDRENISTMGYVLRMMPSNKLLLLY